MRRIVVDTNVLVSGNLSRLGPPGRIVDLVNDGAVVPVYDTRIMVEYEVVLRRPRFHLPASIVTALLDNIRLGGALIAARPLSGVVLPDPADLPFLEVAAAGATDYLVTGNLSHYAPTRGAHTVIVISPREYVDLLDGT